MLNSLSVNHRHSFEWHVVVINLAILVYFSTCTTVKAGPSFIEKVSTPTRQVMSEFSSSFLKIVNPGIKVIVDIVRPFYRMGVNLFQLSVKSLGEFFSSIVENIFSVPVRNKPMCGNYSEKDNNKTNGPRYIFAEDVAHALPIIFLFLVALYIVTQPLNVKK